MEEEVKFLPKEQRAKLQEALRIVNEVLETTFFEYEDYSVIKTSAYYLDRAANFPDKYY